MTSWKHNFIKKLFYLQFVFVEDAEEVIGDDFGESLYERLHFTLDRRHETMLRQCVQILHLVAVSHLHVATIVHEINYLQRQQLIRSTCSFLKNIIFGKDIYVYELSVGVYFFAEGEIHVVNVVFFNVLDFGRVKSRVVLFQVLETKPLLERFTKKDWWLHRCIEMTHPVVDSKTDDLREETAWELRSDVLLVRPTLGRLKHTLTNQVTRKLVVLLIELTTVVWTGVQL